MLKLFTTLSDPRPDDDVRSCFAHLPPLETDRLLLRPVRLRDAQDIYQYASDEEVARHELWYAHRSLADSRAYVRYLIKQYRDGLPSSYAIEYKPNHTVLGTIGFMAYSDEFSTVEVGYSLARPYWNQGIMTEALTAFLSLCFDTLRIHRVEAQHETDNPASGRVMIKCGMRYEGTLRGRVLNKGRFADVMLYAMLREDWEGRA